MYSTIYINDIIKKGDVYNRYGYRLYIYIISMEKNLLLHSFASKYYYDDILYKEESSEFKNLVENILPDEWTMEKMSMFYSCRGKNNKILSQGWKIHISANLNNCKDILKIVVETAVKNNTLFKFMRDKSLLQLSSEKVYPREASGKFITLYPESTDKFLQILEILYNKLKKFEGPYVLSDKRYKDCSVLYYRYGGFTNNFRVNAEGNNIYTLKDIDDREVDDIRNPYFDIPIKISDPVKQVQEDNEESYLYTNYLVNSVLHSSNSGGVYKAVRISNNENVIIKEARPYTCMLNNKNDSIFLRKKEYSMLKILQNHNIAPRPIEIFKDWEHIFLVEEYVIGTHLLQFTSQNNIFYRNFEDDNGLNIYIEKILIIFLKLVDIMKIAHENGFIISDLSPRNIVVNDNLEVKIIDLEACIYLDEKEIYQLSTSGYSEKIKVNNMIKSDLYSLGCIFFSCLINRNEMINLDPAVVVRTLDSLFMDYSIPKDLKSIIIELMNPQIDERPELTDIKFRLEKINSEIKNYKRTYQIKNYLDLNQKYKRVIDECLECIDRIATPHRSDRLFPNTPLVNNPLNITSGALGNLYALKIVNDINKIEKYREWINKKLDNLDVYPPGLYVGLSGIAWTLLEIDEIEKSKQVLSKCEKHSLFTNSYGIRIGLSGYGMTLLKFWTKTKENIYLNKAKNIGDKIIKEAKVNMHNDTMYWECMETYNPIGYGDGSTGISIFLLYLYLATEDETYLKAGEYALKYDLLQKKPMGESGVYSFPSDDKNLSTLYPYFMKGSAGVISALVRYYKVTKDEKYVKEINSILPGIHVKYTASPGLFLGLAGLGNAILDCYDFLENDTYLNMAYNIAEGIDLFKVRYKDGVLFPGDFGRKLSTDFGSGTSGIVLYLNRLINKQKNFCFFLDELFDK